MRGIQNDQVQRVGVIKGQKEHDTRELNWYEKELFEKKSFCRKLKSGGKIYSTLAIRQQKCSIQQQKFQDIKKFY